MAAAVAGVPPPPEVLEACGLELLSQGAEAVRGAKGMEGSGGEACGWDATWGVGVGGEGRREAGEKEGGKGA